MKVRSFLLILIVLISFFGCNVQDYSETPEVNFNFELDLKNYEGNYNYIEATVYDASKIKANGEFRYSNVDFSSLPNGYSSKHKISVGGKASFKINNVPKDMKAVVVVEVLNVEDRVSSVVYGGLSDVFTISKNAKYSIKLEKITPSKNEGTAIYKVEHYQQNLKDDNYTLIETEYKEDFNSNEASDSPREYQGFYVKEVQLFNEGTVVKVYYDRNTFTITLNTNEGNLENTEIKVKYGDCFDNNLIPTKEGYYFVGWYQDEEFTTAFDYSTIINRDYTLFAKFGSENVATNTDVSTMIENLTGEGPHYIKVTGEITSSTISSIKSKLQSKTSSYFIIDLSETIGLSTIESNAFYQCTNLIYIELPESITSIGAYAFYKCSSLTSVKLPKNVLSIGSHVFYGCSSLEGIDIPDGVTTIGQYTFYQCSKIKTIELPESVRDIGNSAFSKCTNLVNIKIPEGVTSIGSSVFSECLRLSKIELPESLTSINSSVFNKCIKLESVCFYGTSIGEKSFYECAMLKEFNFGDKLESIGKEAFYNCWSLESLSLPNTLNLIDEKAFYDCISLESLEIPLDNWYMQIPYSYDHTWGYSYNNKNVIPTINLLRNGYYAELSSSSSYNTTVWKMTRKVN